MKNIAIYPGTFDPITFGHIDVIKKSLKLFDKIVVAVSDESNKNYLFSSNERIEIVKKGYLYFFLQSFKQINTIFKLLTRLNSNIYSLGFKNA